jgi:enamine deaminase RidA (YjgF/YER057c/UK114 family)
MHASTLFTRLALGCSLVLATAAHADEIKRTSSPSSQAPISSMVSVPALSRIVFMSGHLADVAHPAAPKGSIEAYGNTTTQVHSIIKKFEKLLAAEGMTLADVVKVNVFMVGDPELGGKMDFAGLNAAYSQYFGSAAQPNKPVRTALQVAALPMPGGLVEIEMTAAKPLAAGSPPAK